MGLIAWLRSLWAPVPAWIGRRLDAEDARLAALMEIRTVDDE